VPAGPGINDNGSGSSSNIELARNLQIINKSLVNAVRFAWWGAEELGLLGSTYYVKNLQDTNVTMLNNIAMNLNFDMMASPNYVRAVYDGRSANASNPYLHNGSTAIQQLFESYFNNQNETCDVTSFDGRSDYGPFLTAGIPAGGLFTGAEQLKNATLRVIYGGMANAPFDPCYHQYCDSVDNINQEVFLDLAQSSATILESVATKDNLREWLLQGGNKDPGVPQCRGSIHFSGEAMPKRRLRRYIDDLLL